MGTETFNLELSQFQLKGIVMPKWQTQYSVRKAHLRVIWHVDINIYKMISNFKI